MDTGSDLPAPNKHCLGTRLGLFPLTFVSGAEGSNTLVTNYKYGIIFNMQTLRESNFAFLTSVRFWKLVTIGVLQALVSVGAVPTEVAQSLIQILQMILGGSVAIRTVDRFAEKTGDADTGLQQ